MRSMLDNKKLLEFSGAILFEISISENWTERFVEQFFIATRA